MSGVASYLRQMSPHTTVVGAEPLGCPSMYDSLRLNEIITVKNMDTFVDGAAVGRPGLWSFVRFWGYLGDIKGVGIGNCAGS
jgi:threonine dehydratase